MLLAKTHQHFFFLDDVFHAQAGFAPITPDRAGQRRQHPFGFDTAESLEVFQQDILLGFDLRLRLQVLQRAAAADVEVHAARCNPLRRGFQHFLGAGFVEVAMGAHITKPHGLPGQCAVHEYGLAVDVTHAAAVVGQRLDARFRRIGGHAQLGFTGTSHEIG